MAWLWLAKTVASALNCLFEFIRTEQLLSAGEIRARQKALQDICDVLDRARRARRDPSKRFRVLARLLRRK
jgi:hypothetical protein